MNIQMLIATMNKNNIQELNLQQKHIDFNSLIINQTNNNIITQEQNIIMMNFNEIGIANSRNRAIENATGDVCIISDDDVVYVENLQQIINQAFEANPDADIITFRIMTPEGDLFKDYKDEAFEHNMKSILRVSSIEVAFKLDRIKNKNIKFDEKFGLGSKYISGEENIFLMDCIKSGLNIKYVPVTIGIHKKETSGRILNEKAIYSKGALFYRLFGMKCLYLNGGFIVKKSKIIKFNKIRAIYLIYKGTLDYINNK